MYIVEVETLVMERECGQPCWWSLLTCQVHALQKGSGSCSFTSCTVSSKCQCFWCYTSNLMCWRSGFVKVSVWLMIISGALIMFEALNCLSSVPGFRMLRPPRWTGRESSLLSSGGHNYCPVSAGINCWCIASSRGWKSRLALLMDHIRYCHLPWTNAEYTAWGCVSYGWQGRYFGCPFWASHMSRQSWQ